MSGIFDDFLKKVAEDCVNGGSGEMRTPVSMPKLTNPCVECGGRGVKFNGRDYRPCVDCGATGEIK